MLRLRGWGGSVEGEEGGEEEGKNGKGNAFAPRHADFVCDCS